MFSFLPGIVSQTLFCRTDKRKWNLLCEYKLNLDEKPEVTVQKLLWKRRRSKAECNSLLLLTQCEARLFPPVSSTGLMLN